MINRKEVIAYAWWKIKGIRTRKGMTQEMIAERLGVSRIDA